MASRFITPVFQALDSTGKALPGAKLFFFEAGSSSTLKDTFSDEALTTENANPVIADGAGIFPSIYGSDDYRVVLQNSKSVQQWERDNVSTIGLVSLSDLNLILLDYLEEIENVASLRLFEPTNDGQTIFLIGHTTDGIGSGEFYFDESDTSSSDDNGITIVTTLGNRWKRSGATSDLYTPAAWFGIVADVTAVFTTSWQVSGGTDQEPAITAMLASGIRNISFPAGWIRLNSPVEFVGGEDFLGHSAFNNELTSFAFAGGPTETMFKESASVFEVSHYAIRKIRLFDGREQFNAVTPTAGYGIKINNAVNSQVVRECFFQSFPEGCSFFGADLNSRAGDNVDIDMLWLESSVSDGIQLGNLNNTCSISNIFCDGAFPVIHRINGNQLTAVFNFQTVKHEAGTSASIVMFTNDRVVCDGVIARGDNYSAVIEPISEKGSYNGVKGTTDDGTGSFAPFKNDLGVIVGELENFQFEYGAVSMLNLADDIVATSTEEGFLVSGLSGVKEPTRDEVANTKNTRQFISASSTIFLEIATDATVATEICGDMAMHFIGDRRGAALAVFSCFVDASGVVSQADSTIIGGGGGGFTDITMSAPEALAVPEVGKMRIGITNSNVSLSNFLSLVTQVSVRSGSMVL